MDDARLLRYNRHILLPEIDIEGQQKLLDAKVLVVGLGGLGCPAAQYLAAGGVGRLVVVDDDRVELANLQRQVLYGSSSCGGLKADAAAAALRRLNDTIELSAIARRADESLLRETVPDCDAVLDCSDNMATRQLVNLHCRLAGVPLVSAAAIGWQGQLAVFRPGPGEPCYRCLYADTASGAQPACSEAGVAGPVVGVLGVLQALEALKLICGLGQNSSGQLWQFDGLQGEWTQLRFSRRPDCPVCSRQ